MKVQTKKTYMMKAAEVKRAWHVIDVKDRVLGQVATEIATLLMGKNSPMYTPNVDSGHYVIVTNAANVVVTGNKGMRKTYNKHSLFPGGIRQSSFDEMQALSLIHISEAHETRGNLVCRLLLEKIFFLMIRRPPRSTQGVSSGSVRCV